MAILAVSGSLSSTSSNSALLTSAARALPPGRMVLCDALDGLPYFSPDRDRGPAPASVTRWRDAVAIADAVVIATPEYAGGMPGTLKNALDWLVGSGELYGKPVVVVSAAPSADRGASARESLARTLTMQGANVCDSFTVAVHQGRSGDPTSHAAELVERLARALSAAPCASGRPAPGSTASVHDNDIGC